MSCHMTRVRINCWPGEGHGEFQSRVTVISPCPRSTSSDACCTRLTVCQFGAIYSCRATVQHLPLKPQPMSEPPPPTRADTHCVANWADVTVYLFASFSCHNNLWVWAQSESQLRAMRQPRPVWTLRLRQDWQSDQKVQCVFIIRFCLLCVSVGLYVWMGGCWVRGW